MSPADSGGLQVICAGKHVPKFPKVDHDVKPVFGNEHGTRDVKRSQRPFRRWEWRKLVLVRYGTDTSRPKELVSLYRAE